MKFTLTIPDGLPAMTVKELLEEQFLIPRKIRHFLRTKKHVSVNGLSINWQTVVKPGDDVCLIFDEEDYPQKTILLGNGELVEELYQDLSCLGNTSIAVPPPAKASCRASPT